MLTTALGLVTSPPLCYYCWQHPYPLRLPRRGPMTRMLSESRSKGTTAFTSFR